ncbi:MAG TPA: heparan N-sulfatase, partial [Verrucomicrobia bacterium]|nr:heparan N-sulfatase [Verrucomicrobiota bacterium]
APTFLELAGCSSSSVGMQPMAGQSLVEVLTHVGDGLVATRRDHVLIGKERHDVGRPGDVGYPIRGIVQGTHLFLRNFEPARWPAGNPETGYTNTDRSPTKTLILNERRQTGASRYWDLGFGKRPVEELYDVLEDPDCTRNLLAVDQARYSPVADALRATLFRELRAQSDPRMRGQGAIFDAYPYAEEEGRGFYERFIAGRAP